MKLRRKVRVGSRLQRIYDRPQTPLDRLRACSGVDRAKVAELLRLRATTDPFELARTIGKKLDRIAALARHRGAEGRVTKQMA